MDRQDDIVTKGKHGKKNSSGETLVESIVSFAVLMILMLSVATMLRAAVQINRRSMDNIAALEAAAAMIEQAQPPEEKESLNGFLTVQIESCSYEIGVAVQKAGTLDFFAPLQGGGEDEP